MDENKMSREEEIKEWWNTTGKTVFKCVACCGVAWLFGYIKGASTTVDMFIKNGRFVTIEKSDSTYDEDDADDPELLELIKMEEEQDKGCT